jgi:hypothetical protein
METRAERHRAVWGGLLIVFGLMALVESITDVTGWVWVAVLIVAGLGVFGVYRIDRSDRLLLIPAYVMWAVAGLIALVTLGVLPGTLIATYVLTSIALPFLAVYLRHRGQWWALIPAYVLLAIGLMTALIGWNVLEGAWIATYVLTADALPFLVVYLRRREHWWALIPTYVLLAVGLMVGLIGQGVLSGLLIPAYVMFAIGIPFFVIFALDRRRWWALIPSGAVAVIGFAFLLAEGRFIYVGPAVLLAAGAWILLRQLTGSRPD